ncbi:hypothetical protein [Martelella endophytica]|uniref:Uncharacterized protein n=1 Tax=Martelella endophytica TaxID=1486262 RepID=A0A0D5LSI4_MAREN|nr:hypothetical protein [Martelella endophytica]AJY47046.1 hypothetical protein TM49_17370 [Martelella endophytica]
MANTRKFNTTVKIGAKSYAAGEDVPVSKNGLSEADADNLEQVFGKWRKPKDDTVDKRVSALTEERDALADKVEALTKERDALAAATDDGKHVADLKAGITELNDKLKDLTEDRDQLAEDNATLADELKKLQAAAQNEGDDEDDDEEDKA